MDVDANPLGFAICVVRLNLVPFLSAVFSDSKHLNLQETYEGARIPSPVDMRDADDTLTILEDEVSNAAWTDAIRSSTLSASSCGVDENEDPSASGEPKYLRPSLASVVHIACPSSFTPAPTSTSLFSASVDALINFALFLRSQASPPLSSCRLPRRVLLHCGDGYTETCMLALTYTMLSQSVCLPEAYLILHKLGRSFFVYPQDVSVLLRIERRLAEILKKEAERGESSGMERSDSGFAEVEKLSLTDEVGSRSETATAKALRREMKISTPVSHPWFFAETWEGSFPSRILPFLVSISFSPFPTG